MKPEDIKIEVHYEPSGFGMKARVTATHLPTNLHYTASERSAHRARAAAVEGLRQLVHIPTEVCRSPYCECPLNECSQGKVDGRGTYPEYETAPLSTQPPNPYQQVVDDTTKALKQTTKEAKTKVAHQFYEDLETHTQTQYLLDKLQEEAAEVIQAVSKIRRFGPHNHHPDRTETNLQELTGELEDFQAIVWALEEIKYLDPKPSTVSVIKKFNTLISS